ncbi:MAG: type II/IV secretion system protein [Opitutaceae bacterium]|nr:type II/IV secretion system protein [Opitutaceae bacterium]
MAWVDHLIQSAMSRRASDVHIEPFRDQIRVRMRVDGTLEEVTPPPNDLGPEIASRIKVLAKLDIAERRIPQDGHLIWTDSHRSLDLRVSTLPTSFGESVVLRLLDRTQVRHSLEDLGMNGSTVERLKQSLAKPHGLIVVAGPTGSGKTTTLYSALASVDSSIRKVLTVEDPVEFKTDGLIQVAVDEGVGLSFSQVVRAFLRQDPDVIMVGEIRDSDTARVAVQAALTGHLVLTSLHAGSGAGAITRLLDLGIEPFLLSNSLELVVAQRLVRRDCPDCRQGLAPPGLGASIRPADRAPSGSVSACLSCRGSGYSGRTPHFELLEIDESVRALILQRPSTTVLESRLRHPSCA